MNLERIPERLMTGLVTLFGMAFALYCARLTGAGQVRTLAIIVTGCVALFTIVKMRANVWWLIPITWVMAGRIPVLPLPFSVRDICVLFVFASTCVLIALKNIRNKPKFDILDFWMLLSLVYVAITFVRHPVGTMAMGSDRVGGKPYFDVFIATLAFWVLARASISVTSVKRLIVLFTAGPIAQGLISAITYHFPMTVPVIGQFYTGISTETYEGLDYTAPGAVIQNRQAHLFFIGNTLILALCSCFRPITLLIPAFFWRFFPLCIGAVAVLKSGHRTAVLDAAFVFLLASYFRRGIGDVFRILWIGIPLLGIMIMLQGTFIELPQPVQRALSFLPGRWDPIAVADAQGSTTWRVEMWKTVLSGNKYIDNKLLGDGFGYSLREYNAMLAANENHSANASQENAMLQGAFHSGPVSAIRFVGLVGLILFTILMILLAKRAWKLVRQSEGTPFYPLALFICLPVIIEPFKYLVIFGAYDVGLQNSILSLGLLKVLERSLAAQPSTLKPATQSGKQHMPFERRLLAPNPMPSRGRI